MDEYISYLYVSVIIHWCHQLNVGFKIKSLWKLSQVVFAFYSIAWHIHAFDFAGYRSKQSPRKKSLHFAYHRIDNDICRIPFCLLRCLTDLTKLMTVQYTWCLITAFLARIHYTYIQCPGTKVIDGSDLWWTWWTLTFVTVIPHGTPRHMCHE